MTTTMKESEDTDAGSVFCFTCKHWVEKRRKQTAYCLSEKDAPSGCVLWEMLHGTFEKLEVAEQ